MEAASPATDPIEGCTMLGDGEHLEPQERARWFSSKLMFHFMMKSIKS